MRKELQLYAYGGQPNKRSMFGVPRRTDYIERERLSEDYRTMQQAIQSKSASKFLQDQENA